MACSDVYLFNHRLLLHVHINWLHILLGPESMGNGDVGEEGDDAGPRVNNHLLEIKILS